MTLPITEFIVQRLLEFDPNYDVGGGVATTALLVEPLSVILQPIVDELTAVQATQSILTILEADDPDAFPEDIVDAVASNFLVTRDPGGIGSTVQRLSFFSPEAFSAPKGALVWRGQAGQRYANSEAVSITKAEMSLNQEGSTFYVDLPIVALEEGEAFNADAGTITEMEAEPLNVASTRNLFRVDDGRDRETNTELINRIKVAVTVRALVTGRGIIVTLTENFTSIVEIQPTGFGDPEMMRDIVYNVHIGGNVDVWVKTAALSAGQTDVHGLKIDTTRRQSGIASVFCPVESVPVDLRHPSIDRTDTSVVVTTIDNFAVFTEHADYEIDDTTGTITRLPGGGIFHLEETGGGGSVAGANPDRLVHSNPVFFANVRAGMKLTVTGPAQIAKTYTIKAQLAADTIQVYGEFAGPFPISNVNFTIDDLLTVTFDYNPVSVDIVGTLRSAARDGFTITDVPVLRVNAIEELDPITFLPTGTLLSGRGGYGVGGFGFGPYGVGVEAQYLLRVPDPTLRYSVREDLFIEFTPDLIGKSVRILYQWDSNVAALQAFCDDDQNRSETASLLVRHFVPIFVDSTADLTYSIPTSTQATALSADEMLAEIAAFINRLSRAQNLEASDLIDLMYDNGADQVDLDPLLKLQGSIYHQDGAIEFLSPNSKGVMVIPNDPIPDPSSKPLSPNIARFIANAISVTRSLS